MLPMILGAGAQSSGGAKASNSLLFRGGQYLSRTPSVAGNRQKFTLSMWGRFSDVATANQKIMHARGNAGGIEFGVWYGYPSAGIIKVEDTNNATSLAGTPLYRDPTGFGHILVCGDTTDATASNRVRIYFNNMIVPVTGTYPTQNSLFTLCSTLTHYIGADISSGGSLSNYYKDYLCDPILVDGLALDPTYFGQTDATTGSWVPKAPVISNYGTNGFRLGGGSAATAWNSASLGTDYSGKGNTFTTSGFAATDVVLDNPSNVYATWNPVVAKGGNSFTYTNGSLTAAFGGSANPPRFIQTGFTFDVASTTGYAEITVNSFSDMIAIGMSTPDSSGWNNPAFYVSDGTKYTGSVISFGSSYSASSVISIAWKNGSVWFAKNGSWQGGGDPSSNASPAHSGMSGYVAITVAGWTGGGSGSPFNVTANFGQRTFAYTAPSGFKSLCTANLPATTGVTSGSFTGNVNADGPCVYTGAVPLTLTINGNAVTWGTHADKLATGFKIRTSSTSYNSTGTNTWAATYSTPQKPTVGSNGVPANAQGNP